MSGKSKIGSRPTWVRRKSSNALEQGAGRNLPRLGPCRDNGAGAPGPCRRRSASGSGAIAVFFAAISVGQLCKVAIRRDTPR